MGIKLGLVGLGAFGSVFARLFASHPLVDKFALCDCEQSKIKAQLDDPFIKTKVSPSDCYETLDEMCKADLDAIAIITQPWLHAPQAIKVLESGKSVYSAVPVISLPDFNETLDWCGKIKEAEQKSGRHYMLGETTIFRPHTMFCSRMAAERKFGDFVYAEGEYVHDVDASCNLREVKKHRSTGKVGEQISQFMKKYRDAGLKTSPMSYPTHSISGPMHVMQTKALKVCAFGTRNNNGDDFFATYEFSDITALYQLANGASLRICEFREIGASSIDRLESETFRIFGKSGSFAGNSFQENGRTTTATTHPLATQPLTYDEMRDPLPPEVVAAYKDAYKIAGQGDFSASGHGGSHPYLVNEFVTSVAENRISCIPLEEAAHWMAMGAAAHWSAMKDGELVAIPDI